MDLGPRIAAWLRVRNMSQRALAHALGVTPQAVTAWVRHNKPPTQKNLHAMTKAFGVTILEFYGRLPKAKRDAA